MPSSPGSYGRAPASDIAGRVATAIPRRRAGRYSTPRTGSATRRGGIPHRSCLGAPLGRSAFLAVACALVPAPGGPHSPHGSPSRWRKPGRQIPAYPLQEEARGSLEAAADDLALRPFWQGRRASAELREVLGGKGANLAEMCNIGLPGARPGSRSPRSACAALRRQARRQADGGSADVRREVRTGDRHASRKTTARGLRGSRAAAARFRAERRSHLDARHDGHRPESGTDRRGHRRPSPTSSGNRRFRPGCAPPVHPDVRQRRRGCARTRSLSSASSQKNKPRVMSYSATITRVSWRPMQLERASSRSYLALYERTDEGVRSPKIRTSSSTAPSKPSSDPGWASAQPSSTGRSTRSPTCVGTAVNVQAMVFGNLGDDVRHGRLLHARPRHRRRTSSTASF